MIKNLQKSKSKVGKKHELAGVPYPHLSKETLWIFLRERSHVVLDLRPLPEFPWPSEVVKWTNARFHRLGFFFPSAARAFTANRCSQANHTVVKRIMWSLSESCSTPPPQLSLLVQSPPRAGCVFWPRQAANFYKCVTAAKCSNRQGGAANGRKCEEWSRVVFYRHFEQPLNEWSYVKDCLEVSIAPKDPFCSSKGGYPLFIYFFGKLKKSFLKFIISFLWERKHTHTHKRQDVLPENYSKENVYLIIHVITAARIVFAQNWKTEKIHSAGQVINFFFRLGRNEQISIGN